MVTNIPPYYAGQNCIRNHFPLPPSKSGIQIIQNSTNYLEFKTKVSHHIHDTQPTPPWFYTGECTYNILIARLRNRCSNLNHHLFINYLRDTPTCGCGNPRENVDHFLFHCPQYTNARCRMLNSLHDLFRPSWYK